MRNNPVKYNEPTGHVQSCPEETGSECIVGRKQELLRTSSIEIWRKWSSRSPLHRDNPSTANDLNGMTQIFETALALYQGNVRATVEGTSEIILGTKTIGPLSAARSKFTEVKSSAWLTWGDTGFHKDFRDGGNQPYHVWAYIAETSEPGAISGFLGQFTGQISNYIHEFLEGGSSWNDFILSEAGFYVGWQISSGAVDVNELGNLVRQSLGPNAPDALTSKGKAPGSMLEWYILPK